MASSPWIFICPSSRGIGFSLTRHLLRATSLPILATTRNDPSTTKTALLSNLQPPLKSQRQEDTSYSRRLQLVQCDVTDDHSIHKAAQVARDLFPPQTHHLHLSFALAGILTPEKSPSQVDPAASLAMFQVNAVGSLLLAKHFAEFLPRRGTDMGPSHELPEHATWVCMSARVGSITDNRSGGWFSYRASKAAVNSIAKSLDLMLRARSGDKALALAYHPGTVKTDLSKEFWGSVPKGKLFSADYAAERMADVVSGLKVVQRGRCWDWKGEEIPP